MGVWGAEIAQSNCEKCVGPLHTRGFLTFIVQSRPPDFLRTELFRHMNHFNVLFLHWPTWGSGPQQAVSIVESKYWIHFWILVFGVDPDFGSSKNLDPGFLGYRRASRLERTAALNSAERSHS